MFNVKKMFSKRNFGYDSGMYRVPGNSLVVDGDSCCSLKIDLSKIKNLYQLVGASILRVDDFPDFPEILSFISLQFQFSHLKSIPESIQNLKNIQFLDLSNNKFTSLPVVIFKLENIIEFDINTNNISEIPPEIGNLKKMQKFDCSNNEIGYIPNEILNCKSLQTITISDTTIVPMGIDASIVINEYPPQNDDFTIFDDSDNDFNNDWYTYNCREM
jgi:hypothetical protein